jgi:hypothetical protein
MANVLFGPLARRLGTYVAGVLSAHGVGTGDQQTAIVNGVIALALVAADVAMSNMNWFRK